MHGIRLAFISLAVGAAVAQNLPSCANGCIGGDQYGANCNKLDVACICNSKEWIAGLACCVSKTCSASDQADTIAFANKICAGAGVTTLPQTATCASTAASDASSTVAASVATSSSVPASITATSTSTALTNAGGSALAATTASASSSRGAAAIQTAGSVAFGAVLAGLAIAL